ncbi:MAG: CvpA family protein [Bacteroidales bacterium]|jgi:membrane protein required for colicin V production|nr:CvpA family protein [Bacteroidales bacterium]
MNYVIDAVILICLVWGFVKGFRKGLIMQTFSIIAVGLGIWGGLTLAYVVEPYLPHGWSRLACSFVSFLIVFICMMLMIIVAGKIISKLLDAIALGLINRLLGACFGLLVNALVLSTIIVFVNKFNKQLHFLPDSVIRESYLYMPTGKIIPAIFPDKYFKVNTLEKIL